MGVEIHGSISWLMLTSTLCTARLVFPVGFSSCAFPNQKCILYTYPVIQPQCHVCDPAQVVLSVPMPSQKHKLRKHSREQTSQNKRALMQGAEQPRWPWRAFGLLTGGPLASTQIRTPPWPRTHYSVVALCLSKCVPTTHLDLLGRLFRTLSESSLERKG